eukprot:scaffold63400_cov23-Prasinocladus_malaysianus.AAC.1
MSNILSIRIGANSARRDHVGHPFPERHHLQIHGRAPGGGHDSADVRRAQFPAVALPCAQQRQLELELGHLLDVRRVHRLADPVAAAARRPGRRTNQGHLQAQRSAAISFKQGQGVFCLNPAHIPICGKIRVFCFDKTGTLTREGLDFLGFWPMSAPESDENEEPKFSSAMVGEQGGRQGAWGEMGMRALASCHSVAVFDKEYVGNQLEVAMFKATGWSISEAEHHRTKVTHYAWPRLPHWERRIHQTTLTVI